MSLLSTAVVTVLGAACATGTVWWARRAEQSVAPPGAPAPQPAAEPAREPWWERAPWWAALTEDERRWVLQNLEATDPDGPVVDLR
ncbi:hypothetical protein [Cryptosporangium minutisporangium]|uniref:Uncharacterized protein n=1 Tax=Cryptosporangium minutisporangium TaxID=113569 RepID=A0ABP6STJ7_9ACTN